MSLASALSTTKNILNNTATQTGVLSTNVQNVGNSDYNRRSAATVQPFELRASDGNDYWFAYQETRRHSKKIRAFRDFMRLMMPSFRD